MSVPPESLNKEAKQKQLRRVSEKFCASDADVTFVSFDNVLFYIHRRNLEITAGAFPPAEFDTQGEEVPLTEDAETLEFLFQYVYPQRHPHLGDVPISTLALLAEAAEKYQVFSAMSLCYVRMKNTLPEHALEIFNYASRHDYTDILGDAAPALLDIALDEIVKRLSTRLIIPWVCYREAWSRAALKAVDSLPGTECYRCEKVNSRAGDVRKDLGDKRSRAALKDAGCDDSALERELSKVPGFVTFL